MRNFTLSTRNLLVVLVTFILFMLASMAVAQYNDHNPPSGEEANHVIVEFYPTSDSKLLVYKLFCNAGQYTATYAMQRWDLNTLLTTELPYTFSTKPFFVASVTCTQSSPYANSMRGETYLQAVSITSSGRFRIWIPVSMRVPGMIDLRHSQWYLREGTIDVKLPDNPHYFQDYNQAIEDYDTMRISLLNYGGTYDWTNQFSPVHKTDGYSEYHASGPLSLCLLQQNDDGWARCINDVTITDAEDIGIDALTFSWLGIGVLVMPHNPCTGTMSSNLAMHDLQITLGN